MTTLRTIDAQALAQMNRALVGFDKVFNDRFFNGTTSNYPPYNIVKYNDNDYGIEVAVAGFDESELDVEVSNNQLIIRGAKEEQPNSTVQYQHKGIATRNFELAFQLTDDLKVKGAAVKNGILTVRIEYIVPEEAKPKKVAITFEK